MDPKLPSFRLPAIDQEPLQYGGLGTDVENRKARQAAEATVEGRVANRAFHQRRVMTEEEVQQALSDIGIDL